MMRIAWLFPLCLLACREKATVVESGSDPDPVARVEAWLRDDVFADPPTLPFARDLQPAAFPPRQVAGRPEAYRFVDLWRVRFIDGRLLVDALITLDGRPHTQGFYLEEVEGRWQIAGWSPAPEPVESPTSAPPGGADLPATLAAATFRGAPPASVVPIAPPSEADEVADDHAAVRVGFKAFTFAGECPTARLTTALRRTTRAVAACHAEAFGAHPRPGRLTFELDLGPSGAQALLKETTLLAGALTDCVAEALQRVPADKVTHCTITVPITFTPRTE